MASLQEHAQNKKRGEFICLIAEVFQKWRGPDGQRFGNQFFAELLMGKLADAWVKEIASDKAVTDRLSDALAANDKLTALNAQLSAGGVAVTPAGTTLDASDLQTVDAIIAKHADQVPVPTANTP